MTSRAMIGRSHILNAACLNAEVALVIHNNMLYGMTGGQSSGLTPGGFRIILMPEGKPTVGYDVYALGRAPARSASLVHSRWGDGPLRNA